MVSLTEQCKNITFPQLRLRAVKIPCVHKEINPPTKGTLKVAEFPKLALIHGILLSLLILI